ncbi:MAG: 1-deoxy-D-xylulose-5-phosphate reductoisomerase [Eubacteriales bacterium]|jgi:1-deoxy-D-xylulose-5-phosphate reductoisomerase|nr:1-deoxy-D-xylulose-5-phosphate reductoisomerase [Clostridiales bacterium]
MTYINSNKPVLSILGSTGSIGRQTLEVAEKLGTKIDFMCAGSNDVLFEAQVRRFRPRAVAMSDERAASRLKTALADMDVVVMGGADAVMYGAGDARADITVVAISGMAAAKPMMAAASACRRIAMANKEAVVAAGNLLLSEISARGAEVIPVDSEHSAIFQCIGAGQRSDLRRVILTASGGPFFGRSAAELKSVTLEEALSHPTWSMGAKITVDSATLINKGFEVIEAMCLFGLSADQIDVVIHRESIIHSMVEFTDGTVIAQLGLPDMRTAIQYALTHPARTTGLSGRLDFTTLGSLTFAKPDMTTFPLLSAAFDAARQGGTYPAVLSAADEIAVNAFLLGKIGFSDIARYISDALSNLGQEGNPTLAEILEADAEARAYVRKRIDRGDLN